MVNSGLNVVWEEKSDFGCKGLFEASRQTPERYRADFYEKFLKSRLANLPLPSETQRMPLVISGMASSTIGWKEVPYLCESLKLDASNLRFEKLQWDAPAAIDETFLISGVALHPEIMRGEETEAIGLMRAGIFKPEDALLVLPGTHSKHLTIEGGAVTAIATYMTGELFDVIGRHSVLSASVNLTAPDEQLHESQLEQAFDDGVKWVRQFGLARSLFRVRTRSVLDRASGEANRWFLSGIVIGAEALDLQRAAPHFRIMVAAPPNLALLYERAFRALMLPHDRWTVLPPDVTTKSVITAHAMFLESIHD